MSLLKQKAFTLFLIVFNLLVNAQREGFTCYTTKEGLLSDEVYNLHQDKLGYIWAFTNYGALKYNGVEFKPVLKNLPFNESFIYSFYENKKGEKWAANSNAKIYKIVNDSAFLIKGTEKVSEDLRKTVSEIYQLYVDDSLNIYAITKKYSYKFIKKNGNNYIPVNISTQLKYNDFAFHVLERGNVLLPVYNLRGRETNYFDNKNYKLRMFLQHDKKLALYELTKKGPHGAPKLFKKFGKEVYFSFFNRIGVIDEKKKTVHYQSLNSFILNFTKDKYGHTWLACLNNGIYELDENDSIVHHYLGNITINDILVDSQNGLWASSPGQGLFHYNNLNTFYFKTEESLGQPISFVKKIEDKLFIGNVKGEVLCTKNTTFQYIGKVDEKTKDVFYKNGKSLDITKFGQEYYLSSLFGYRKLQIYEDLTSKVLSGAEISNVYKLMEVGKDSFLYVQRRGLGFIVKEGLRKRIDVDYKTYDFIRRGNTFFVATEKGIRMHNTIFPKDPKKNGNDIPIVKDSLSQPDFLLATKNSLIKRALEGPKKTLWFCSAGDGIFLLDTLNNLTQLSSGNGLPSNVVNNINFPENGDILMSTNIGLFFSKSGPKDPKLLKWIRIYNGEVENAVFFKDKIYLATSTGLVIMDYDRIDQTDNLNFNLSGFLINSTEQNFSKLKNLDHRENTIEFKFDVIHFAPRKINIVYSLKGPLNDSGLVEGSTLKFQNLPPGNYTLEAFPEILRGRNFVITLPFTIQPAFWQTLTFIFCSVLFLLIALIIILLLIFRNIKIKRDRKEQAERLIMEYKLIALKAQINPHFMSNCLSAIQLLIINNKVDSATRYIAKFGLLVRQILNFSTRSLISVREELEISILNMDLEQLRFENKFEYEINVDETIVPKDVFVPALILNPIIENAIWHGLLPLKNTRKGKLKITIKRDLNMLLLIIEDNGVGRRQKNQNLSNSRQSKGVQLTEQRLSNINYLYSIDTAKIIYNDLLEEGLTPAGTRVIISLPLNLIPLNYE